jgi:hypothetical protein
LFSRLDLVPLSRRVNCHNKRVIPARGAGGDEQQRVTSSLPERPQK